MSNKKRLLTGAQPSGDLHIGNYFGALKPFVDAVAEYEGFLMIADYHALTSLQDPEQLRHNTTNLVRSYLAAGVDPAAVTVFRQSDNQDHMELGWILNCLVTVPFLQQAHAYKDKVAKGIEPSAGLFTYPMLQAADITLYDTDVVPVGEDQRQHVEYTREAVGKFNRAFGDTLKAPQEMILDGVGVVPGIDGQKMSKSYKNTIPLFGSPAEVEQAVMRIVTDSTGTRPEHVYAIHRLLKTGEELEPLYTAHAGQYGELKKILASDLETVIAPLRERYHSITDADVADVLKDGAERARAASAPVLKRVRKAVGVR